MAFERRLLPLLPLIFVVLALWINGNNIAPFHCRVMTTMIIGSDPVQDPKWKLERFILGENGDEKDG
ncbi:hypothetical protein DERF_014360 [Dermatophagoides farinae]|uniref:Uncharacterized protein n=1 Tax=Dermatophagoides farinae TaxID=6954 RepID=A0A922HNW7_DERFA|nr:hypothetical protein DERF_014360 [Dermatophagoides farinae]